MDTAHPPPILIQANAKINLDLKILDKRLGGYHQIESIIQSIDLSDFLLFEKSKKKPIYWGYCLP